MKYRLLLFGLSFTLLSYAQDKSSSLFSTFQGADLNAETDSLAYTDLSTNNLKFRQRLDSLQIIAKHLDTLSIQHQLESLEQRMQQLYQWPDSLQRLQANADSLQGVLHYSHQLNQQLASLKQKISGQLTQGLEEGLAKLGNQQEYLPELPQASLPLVPDGSLPQLPNPPSTNVPNLKLPGSTEIGEVLQLNLPREGLPQLPHEISQAKELLETAKQLQPDSLMQSDKTDERIAQQLARQEEFAYFQEQKELPKESLEKALPKPQDYNRKAVIQKAVELTPEQLREKKQQIVAAHAALDKYKKRYDQVEDIKKLPKNPLLRNGLRGKPWQELLIPGMHMQFLNADAFRIDGGPSMAWRLYPFINVGTQLQYRITTSLRSPYVFTDQPVWGYSLFTDVTVIKGFFLRASVNHLNLVPRQPTPATETPVHAQWTTGFSAALGRRYRFYKNITGFALTEYSFQSYQFRPTVSPVQARIGFEFKLKKKSH